MMNQEKAPLFSERVALGTRNYFFDVREAENGNKFLSINETRKVGEDFKRSSIMIFEDDLLKFNRGLKNVTDFIVNQVMPAAATEEDG
jgi:hypothetical protein